MAERALLSPEEGQSSSDLADDSSETELRRAQRSASGSTAAFAGRKKIVQVIRVDRLSTDQTQRGRGGSKKDIIAYAASSSRVARVGGCL